MNFEELFRQRYDVLYNFWLAVVWDISEDLMRQRPHPRVNSIAWNLWHIARVEDAGINRFVADRPQVLDEGGWMQKMNIPWRHHGSEMTFPEVDELNERIHITTLREYTNAVHERTLEVVKSLNLDNLSAIVPLDHVRTIIINEGLAHSQPEGFIKTYLGWTKGKCLMNFCLTHPYQHVGEIGVIASLLGLGS